MSGEAIDIVFSRLRQAALFGVDHMNWPWKRKARRERILDIIQLWYTHSW